MKKIISLILVLVFILALSACGKVEITMQEIYDATLTEALLQNHESAYIRDDLDSETFGEKYLTEAYVYDRIYDEEFDWAEFMTDDVCYSYFDGGYVRYLPIAPDGLSDFASERAENYTSVILGADTMDEIIESVSKKDGRITVTSVLSQKNLENLAADGVTSGKLEYVLDAKTREFISLTADYILTDGKAYHMAAEISYDKEAPELVKTFLAYESQTENLRNITVVSNPGSENEVSQSVQVAKGLILGFRYADDLGYTAEFYTDDACTEIYDPYADTDSDLTIYVKWVA